MKSVFVSKIKVIYRTLEIQCVRKVAVHLLTLSLLMSYIYIYIYGAPSKARNLTYIYIYGRDFLLGILLLEPCISLIYA
jgi:hypothetical protein